MRSGSYCLYSSIGLVTIGILVCLLRAQINGLSIGIIWGLAFLTIIGGMILDRFSEDYSPIYEQIFSEPMNSYEPSDTEIGMHHVLRRPMVPTNYHQDGHRKRVNHISHKYRAYY